MFFTLEATMAKKALIIEDEVIRVLALQAALEHQPDVILRACARRRKRRTPASFC